MQAKNPLPAVSRRAFAIALASALAIGWVGIASAQGKGVTGESFLEVKNDAQMTLQLEEVLVQVTEDTRIFNGDKKRIKFAAIPDPNKTQLIVEYSGTRSGKDQITARQLVVKQAPQ